MTFASGQSVLRWSEFFLGSVLGLAFSIAMMQLVVRGMQFGQSVVGHKLLSCTVVFNQEGNGISHFDNVGVRANGNPAPSPTSKPKKLVVLEDSQTEALGVDDTETFASVAERTLGSDAFRLLNLGTGGRAVPDYILAAPAVKQKLRPIGQLSPSATRTWGSMPTEVLTETSSVKAPS